MKQDRLILTLSLLTLAMALWGCPSKTPVPQEHQTYLGAWHGEFGSSITIFPDGTCSYEQKRGTAKTSISGGAVGWQGNQLICDMMVTSKFMINQPPQQAQGKWTMRLDGELYQRGL